MRDEFAQKLWIKAATPFAYLVVLIPFVAVAIIITFSGEIVTWLESGGELFRDRIANNYLSELPADATPADTAQALMFFGVVELVFEGSIYAPFTFFAIYKLYRWRESR